MMEIKLPTEVKAKWLTALRSGAYKQTIKHLHTDAGYCCLGVLYEALGGQWYDKAGDAYKTQGGGTGLPTGGDVDHETYRALMQYQNGCPVINMLTRMNDTHEPFSKIADYIEKEL